MGTQLSLFPNKRGIAALQFSMWSGWIKMPLSREVGLGPGHIVLDGDPAPPLSKGHSLIILAHVCCGQTAGWIKMPPGREVGLGPGHIVLDGDPAPPPPKGQLLIRNNEIWYQNFSVHYCCK